MIFNYLLAPKVFKSVLSRYAFYQEKVTQIMMLRSDITEEKIVELTTEMFNSTTMSMASVLSHFIFLAKQGEHFPGENETLSSVKISKSP